MRNNVIITSSLDNFYRINQMQGEVSILDVDQVYHHITPLQNNVLGYSQKPGGIIGKTNFDIQAPVVELAPQFFSECQSVIERKVGMVFFCSGKFAKNEIINYVYSISPIMNHDKKALGIIVAGERLCGHSNALTAIQYLYDKIGIITNYKTFLMIEGYPHLTQKESQCLYWLLRGRSAGQTADILFLSRRTVESHLESIKNKYSCKTKAELHDYCCHSGFLSIFPVF
jgi:DNA-binding CsgD family transcriptional regulator